MTDKKQSSNPVAGSLKPKVTRVEPQPKADGPKQSDKSPERSPVPNSPPSPSLLNGGGSSNLSKAVTTEKWDWDRAEMVTTRFNDAYEGMKGEWTDYHMALTTTRAPRTPLSGTRLERLDQEISRTKATIANLEKFKQYHDRFKKRIEQSAKYQPEAVEAWEWIVSVFKDQETKSEFTVPRMVGHGGRAYNEKKAKTFKTKTIRLPEDFEATGRMLIEEQKSYGNVVRALQIERKFVQIEDEVLDTYDNELDASQEEFYVWAMTKLKSWRENDLPEGGSVIAKEEQGATKTHLVTYRSPMSTIPTPRFSFALTRWDARVAIGIGVVLLVLVACVLRAILKRRGK